MVDKKEERICLCEEVLLGALILRPEAYDEIKDILSADDFFYEKHKNIFKFIKAIRNSDNCLHVARLMVELKCDAEYMYELGDKCYSTDNIKSHAEIIRESSVQRNLEKAARNLHRQVSEFKSHGLQALSKDEFTKEHLKLQVPCVMNRFEQQIIDFLIKCNISSNYKLCYEISVKGEAQ